MKTAKNNLKNNKMKEFIYKFLEIQKIKLLLDDNFQKFRNLLNYVKKQGINPKYSHTDNARIQFVNEFSIYLSPIYLVLVYIFFTEEHWAALSMVTINLILTPLLPVFNRKSHRNLAAILLHITSTLTIFIASCSLGFEFGIQYLYLPTLCVPIFLLPEREKRSIVSCIIFVIFLFITGELSNYSIWKYKTYPENSYLLFDILSFIIASLFLVWLLSHVKEIFRTEEHLEKEEKKLISLLNNEIIERQKMEESWLHAIHLQEEIMNCIPSNAMILDKEGYLLRHNHFSQPFPKQNISQIESFRVGIHFPSVLEDFYANTNLKIEEIYNQFDDNKINEYKNIEFEYKKDLDTYWYALELNQIKNESFSGFFILHKDITNQKKIELHLQKVSRMQNALKRALPDLLFNLTGEGIVTDFHADKDSSLYMIRELMIGKNLKDFDIPIGLFTEIMNTLQQVLKSGNSHIIRYQFQFKNKEYFYEARMARIDHFEAVVLLKRI